MKQVYIMSGLPGSGKSTYAKKLRQHVQNTNPNVSCCIFGADSFRYDAKGKYVFSSDDNAHGKCLRSYLGFIKNLAPKDGDICAIVDNTSTAAWEIAPYAALADAYGCAVEIITVFCDLEVAYQGNTHEVPLNVLTSMNQKLWQRSLPRHWKYRAVLRTASGFLE